MFPWELPKDEDSVEKELDQGNVNRFFASVFKFVFCKEERKPIFLDLVNALVFPNGERSFKEVRFIDREMSPTRDEGKGGHFDILAFLDGDSTANVEFQAAPQPDFL